jgi:nucleoside-diphosphate-sugar epimerase
MIRVTGGTGLVGSHLLYSLLNRGYRVRALYREGSKLDRVKQVFALYGDKATGLFEQIDWFESDVNDLPRLQLAIKGITHIYHCAAWISFDPARFKKLKKINVEGTANMVNLSLEHGIQKFCFVSSIASLGTTIDNSLITEETHWNPEDDNSVYAISKYAAEMEVWRATQEGLNAVIVNPSVILGTGLRGSGSGSLIRMASKGQKYYTPGGLAVVDVRDVVMAMIMLMESDISGERFILAGENLYNRDFFNLLAREFEVAGPTKSLSRWKLSLLRLLDWLANRFFGNRRRLFRSTIRSLFSVSFYDGSKIESTIPFTYTPVEESIKWIAKNTKKEAVG